MITPEKNQIIEIRDWENNPVEAIATGKRLRRCGSVLVRIGDDMFAARYWRPVYGGEWLR